MNETNKGEVFIKSTGADYFLTEEAPDQLVSYLGQRGWLGQNEHFQDLRKAGEGNMNLTLRLVTNQGQYIVKQSRPWVEKYPQVAAPVERILMEAAFLERTAKVDALSALSPNLLQLDAQNYLMLMQDLGEGSDLSAAYQKGQRISMDQLEVLIDYLSTLHAQAVDDFPANLPLRKLNHEHIFVYPYLSSADTGLDLDSIVPGLAKVAAALREDQALLGAATELGQHYLAAGSCLLHGDFYPGSWLIVDKNTFVIDAEFAHPGRPEFDLGVMLAHLHFTGVESATIDAVRGRYVAPPNFEPKLVNQFLGAELIRRLIGLAQLPLDADLEQRKAWLEIGRRCLLDT